MLALQQAADAARFLLDDMVEDVIERLAFLRVEPARALVIGDVHAQLAGHLAAQGVAVTSADPAHGLDDEAPLPSSGLDLVVALGTLDTVNDLPGALIHMRAALAPGGLMIAQFPGAGSLPVLRAAMLAADADRPAPRIHPQIDVRAGGQLLQRAGFADPVVDSRGLDVSYAGLDRLVADLRAQALSAVLAQGSPRLTRSARMDAHAAFTGEERTVEHFEILTLSGWRR
jgi:SAM-dependent methyltransferase